MHILMLVDFYPPIIGGMELHVRNLGAELVTRGHEVSVVTLWHEGAEETEIDRGVKVYRICGTTQRIAILFSDHGRRFSPPIPDPETVWEIRRIIKNERPDIVHAHSWIAHSFIPLKRWSHAKLVLTLHDYGLSCPKKTLMFNDAPCDGPEFRKCLGCSATHYGFTKGAITVSAHRAMDSVVRSNIDMVLPVSQAVAIGSKLLAGERPFQIVPNFIPDDLCRDQEVSQSYITQLPEAGYLLFVGALIRDKGIEVLLQAYADLSDAPPLVVIGAIWPDSPTKFPSNVVLLKDWPHEAVMVAWSRSLVGLVPSIWPEPCPTVVMEAMACGRPVIASKIGGLPELVVDGETGLLVEPGDPMALKRAISCLLANPELREKMGKAGKARVLRFQASTVVGQIEQAYERVMEKS